MHLGRGPPLESPQTEAQRTVTDEAGGFMARRKLNLKLAEPKSEWTVDEAGIEK